MASPEGAGRTKGTVPKHSEGWSWVLKLRMRLRGDLSWFEAVNGAQFSAHIVVFTIIYTRFTAI